MNKEINGGELTDLPNEKYKKFFDKSPEIETLDINQWKPAHLIFYFCKKYQEQYGVKYSFKFNSPAPSKCFEVFQIKKLASMLTSNPVILKDYIDWIFLNKVVKAKRRLTSISFITVEGVVNEYKLNVLLAETENVNIGRATPLPEKYKNILHSKQINVSTYGDLSFVWQMNPMPGHISEALNIIEFAGFDISILSRII